MSKEKRRVPKLRFPGFTEDWEQRKLNEFLSVSNLKNTENKYNKKDVLSVSGDYGIVNQIEFQGRSFAGVSVSNYGVVEKGDIVYTKSPLKLNPYGIIKTNRINNGIVSTLYAIYKTKENCDSKFIEHYFNLDSRLNQYLKPLVNKGAKNDMKVSSENALVGEVCFPQITEQAMIADLLDRLDIYITLHQRKLDNLKLKKKALLQKLFPKNGERYPELRFSGFTDAWEQCKLGEIFEYLQNNTLSRDSLNYKNPNIKNIHYGDILVKFDEILDGSNKDIPYINSEVDLSKFSKSLLRDGDIIFSDTAEDDTVGKAIELQNVNAPFILSGLHTIPCRPIIPFGKGYLGNFLNSASYRLQLRPLVQGIKVSSISKSALKDTMIEYPINLDEQEKIGSLFYYIAKMITLHR